MQLLSTATWHVLWHTHELLAEAGFSLSLTFRGLALTHYCTSALKPLQTLVLLYCSLAVL